jgi:hypothetical protein
MNLLGNLNDELMDPAPDDNQFDNDSVDAEIVNSAEDMNEVQIVEGNSVGSEAVDDTCYDEPLAIFEQIFDITSE